jgi:hypothetical protein
LRKKIDIIHEQIEAFKRGDRETMRKNLADDLIWFANEPKNIHGHGGVIRGPEAFLECAFSAHLHTDNVKSVKINADTYLTDERVVMVRQLEDIERADGTVKQYVFLKCYEFNDKDQIRRCWEVTNSDFADFPFS